METIDFNAKPGKTSADFIKYIIGKSSQLPNACNISNKFQCDELKYKAFSDLQVDYESRYFNKTLVFNDGRVLDMDYLSNSFVFMSQPNTYQARHTYGVWIK